MLCCTYQPTLVITCLLLLQILFSFNSVHIHEAFMGNVLTAGQGQAPCRQAVIGAGLSSKIICTTVNKVCASGMKSVMLSADAIRANHPQDGKVYLAGGFESMTNAPHYIFHRGNLNKKLGHMSLLDATIHDGLWDVYNDQHMVRRKYRRRK